MQTEKMTLTVDLDENWMYRTGGVSALVLGVAYLVIIGLYAQVGAPPNTATAWLAYLPGKTTVWWAILGLSVLTDFLFVPIAFALFLALKGIQRSAMLLAVALIGAFVALDLVVTWSNYGALLVLSRNYAAATSESQRAAILGAASYAAAVLASPLEVVYAIVDLSTGILITGLVMLKGVFNKATAWLGIITGLLGIAALTGWGPAYILNAVCATLWILLVGYKLVKM